MLKCLSVVVNHALLTLCNFDFKRKPLVNYPTNYVLCNAVKSCIVNYTISYPESTMTLDTRLLTIQLRSSTEVVINANSSKLCFYTTGPRPLSTQPRSSIWRQLRRAVYILCFLLLFFLLFWLEELQLWNARYLTLIWNLTHTNKTCQWG